MLAAETWLSASEAVSKGFADEISGQSSASAKIPAGRYKNVPASLQSRIDDLAIRFGKIEDVGAAIDRLKDKISRLRSTSTVRRKAEQLRRQVGLPA